MARLHHGPETLQQLRTEETLRADVDRENDAHRISAGSSVSEDQVPLERLESEPAYIHMRRYGRCCHSATEIARTW